MFCQKCGNSIDEGVSFCPSCGNKISNSSNAVISNQPKEKLLTKEEFIFSKPHLKDKHNTIKNAKIFNEIFSVIVWLVTIFIIYQNFDKSKATNFFKWVPYNLDKVLIPMLVALIISFLATILINILYTKNSNIEIDKAYNEYLREYNGQNRKDNASMHNGTGWECPKCGCYNQQYVGTCSCGTRKP